MKSLRYLLAAALAVPLAAADLPRPAISRVYPLGGQRGISVNLEIQGEYLSNAHSVEFDCQDLRWTETTEASSGRLTGLVSIASDASLGRHLLRVSTAEGYSTSAIFNVGQFPDVLEAEPNNLLAGAQRLDALPAEVQGILEGPSDLDVYAIKANAGERWSLDLRSIEYGSAVEVKMFLLDAQGRRVAFNDDRDDYLESPLLDYTFQEAGTYYIQLDQYRGPRGFNFGKSSTYILRISELPTVRYVSPLGARAGSTTTITLYGTALESVEQVYLTQIRAAEYARMTYPFTMPIHFEADPPAGPQVPRIEGQIVSRTVGAVEARFAIPADARSGLWRVWAAGPRGTADGPSIELADLPEYSESQAPEADWRRGAYIINGALAKPGEQDVYAIHVVKDQPLHFWTLATQLGVPHIDPVLTLRDSSGQRIAENDDIVAGQGTLIGNPDSSLFHTPKEDGVLFMVVKDRTSRGGPSYQYRLKVKSERPSFQLFTTPENLTVVRGGEAEIKVHLIREQGFEGEVSIWLEGPPGSIENPRGKFRADQLFEPNADGADMIIPEMAFQIRAPEPLPTGSYPIQVFGTPTAEESRPDRRLVEARNTVIMGPLLDLWNFVRRPLPRIGMTVVEPFEARLTAGSRTLTLRRGGTAQLELTAEALPEDAEIQLRELPPGVNVQTSRRGADRITLAFEGAPEAPLGSFDISAEARVEDRWAPTAPIKLTIEPPAGLRAGR